MKKHSSCYNKDEDANEFCVKIIHVKHETKNMMIVIYSWYNNVRVSWQKTLMEKEYTTQL